MPVRLDGVRRDVGQNGPSGTTDLAPAARSSAAVQYASALNGRSHYTEWQSLPPAQLPTMYSSAAVSSADTGLRSQWSIGDLINRVGLA